MGVKLEINLDSDQQKIVDLNGGYYAVLAGAGSGKSTVLLHRAGRLYGTGGKNKVLCVTFTSEAAKNLRNRAARLFPVIDSSVFSTLHSLALRFAYEHSDAFPFHLADNLLADESLSARAVFDSIGDKINFRAFTTWVSLQKRNRVSANEAIYSAEKSGVKLDYAIGYKRYQQTLRKQGLLDFDDLIYYMVEILETRPDIRSQWQFEYIMQDEAQDACELDWKLLKNLSEKYRNLLCVGDSGQALFGFRGGVPHHLMNMNQMFPGTRRLYLGNNYRSMPSIVDFGKLAYPYPEVSSKFTPIRKGSGDISVTPYSSDTREAEEVIKRLSQCKPEECAILARTNLALRPFEEACLDAGLSYHLLGDSGFWEAPEVQNVLYYLRCAAMLTDNAVLGAIRTPFWPSKYVKKKAVIERIKLRTERGETAWEAIQNMSELSEFRNFIRKIFAYKNLTAKDAIVQIIKDLKAIEHYKDEANINPDRNPVLNLKELAHAAERYGTIEDMLSFLRRITHARNSRKGVCLSTIHSAKGKEWKNVFLVSVNEGILPHSKSESEEEERCCFFVGVSRAEDLLAVSYYGTPSRFLKPWLGNVSESGRTEPV